MHVIIYQAPLAPSLAKAKTRAKSKSDIDSAISTANPFLEKREECETTVCKTLSAGDSLVFTSVVDKVRGMIVQYMDRVVNAYTAEFVLFNTEAQKLLEGLPDPWEHEARFLDHTKQPSSNTKTFAEGAKSLNQKRTDLERRCTQWHIVDNKNHW